MSFGHLPGPHPGVYGHMGRFRRAVNGTAVITIMLAPWPVIGAAIGPEMRSTPALIYQAGNRAPMVRYGLNLTLALYQFDEARSRKLDPEVRLSQTFDSLEAERGFLERSLGLEDLQPRHFRSVGLETGEVFRDGVVMGDQPFSFLVRASRAGASSAAVDLHATYGSAVVLEAKNVKLANYETVLIKGGMAKFSAQVRPGPHRTEGALPERTLLVSATGVIVPASKLPSRPHDISHPSDEFGRELSTEPGDIFIPPAVIEAYVPRFTTRRAFKASVLVEGLITPDGRPTNVRAIRSSDSDFDNLAIDAFRQFKFRAASLNGKQLFATLRIDVTLAGSSGETLEKYEPPKRRRPRKWP